MRKMMWLAAAGLLAIPAHAAVDLSAALKAMGEYNLIVLGTLTTNGQEVEGKTFARNLVSNNWTNYGVGNGQQAAATGSNANVLTVVESATGSVRLKAGNANGGNGIVGDTMVVGRDLGNFDFNDTGKVVGKIQVGRDITGQGNVNNHPVSYGRNVAGGVNGAKQDTTLAQGGSNDLYAGLTTQLSDLTTNLGGLSTYLAGLTPLASITSKTGPLDYSKAANGYAVFEMTADAFTGGGEFDTLFGSISENYVTIINVKGSGALTAGGNNNKTSLNQKLIWNFQDATELNFNGFHGSILATNATVTNRSALEGSIVAKDFNLNGEVHLGTFNGDDGFLDPPLPPEPPLPPVTPPSAVPEPASWAMMIAGFGAVGVGLRSRRRRPLVA